MGTQIKPGYHNLHHRTNCCNTMVSTFSSRPTTTTTASFINSSSLSVWSSRFISTCSLEGKRNINVGIVSERSPGLGLFNKDRISTVRRRRNHGSCIVLASGNVAAPFWDSWKPAKGSANPSLSDILWPSAGAFAAMAILGKVDQILAPKGVSMTIAPLGAVCAVLFTAPSTPAARKYNIFMAQIGCAAIGVIAFSLFGPGWLARSAGLAASIAFMIFTRSAHPPAASLPILFVDGVKLHNLNFWYALFPGAAGCVILCLIQEIVSYLKDNLKF